MSHDGGWGGVPISWVPHILMRGIGALNIFSFLVQIQKNSSNIFHGHGASIFDPTTVNKLFLTIQQILWYHELKGCAYFCPCTHKDHWSNFFFPEFAPAWKKSVYYICAVFRYSMNLYQYAKNHAISFICSGDMVD